LKKILLVFGIALVLGGCASSKKFILHGSLPYAEGTPTTELLRAVPQLNQPVITIAVYSFPDRSGQRKPSTRFSQLSTAVSQAPETYLIDALKSVGNGDWFTVVERQGLDSLIKERQLIRSTREAYDGDAANSLKPLLFAGLLVEGGIVSYDSNVVSGGEGARYFGIGAYRKYRTDQVTVSLRLVAVQTGEILLSVSSTKTIASQKIGGDAFKFLDLGTKALEVELGVARNEPTNYAIRTAIEYSVLQMVEKGEAKGLWKYKKKEEE
jgi:curli production assembly/transport component CsgG